MGSWAHILEEVQQAKKIANQEDELNNSTKHRDWLFPIHQKYLQKLSEVTGRNVIVYFSGWLQKRQAPRIYQTIDDSDMTGFMSMVHSIDRSKGTDLILHTPGGEFTATESIVNYLRYATNGDLRAIIPHLAMSAGSMISLACRSIVMGEQSSMGPIDPQIAGAPAHAIIEEFEKAKTAYKNNPHEAQAWQPILEKYTPTLIGSCEKAVKMSEQVVGEWLETGMLKHLSDRERAKTRKKIIEEFSSHDRTFNHGRHFTAKRVKGMGVVVERLEDNQEFQDATLSVHHLFSIICMLTAATKIMATNLGGIYMLNTK